MDTKICLHCGFDKPLSEYGKGGKKSPLGKLPRCKLCQKDYRNNYYANHKKRIRELQNEAWKQPLKKLKSKEYSLKNADKLREYRLSRYNSNKEKILKLKKDWYDNNREKAIATVVKCHNKRKEVDPLYKLKHALRLKIIVEFRRSFNRKKPQKTNEILGASYNDVKIHLENQFRDGMNWDNRGFKGWHIDHIIPLSSAKTEEELMPLFHYTNLQPLWAKDNLKKRAKILPEYLDKAP